MMCLCVFGESEISVVDTNISLCDKSSGVALVSIFAAVTHTHGDM